MTHRNDDTQTKNVVVELQSSDWKTRDQAVDDIIEDQNKLIKHLIGLVDPKNSDQHSEDTRAAAAYLLGELRSIEAIPVLSMSLENPPCKFGSMDYDRLKFYPILTALVKIGRPVVPAMLKNIENSESDSTLSSDSLYILVYVLGGKRHLCETLSKYKNEKLKTATPNDEVIDRIQKAIDYSESQFTGDRESLY